MLHYQMTCTANRELTIPLLVPNESVLIGAWAKRDAFYLFSFRVPNKESISSWFQSPARWLIKSTMTISEFTKRAPRHNSKCNWRHKPFVSPHSIFAVANTPSCPCINNPYSLKKPWYKYDGLLPSFKLRKSCLEKYLAFTTLWRKSKDF